MIQISISPVEVTAWLAILFLIGGGLLAAFFRQAFISAFLFGAGAILSTLVFADSTRRHEWNPFLSYIAFVAIFGLMLLSLLIAFWAGVDSQSSATQTEKQKNEHIIEAAD